MLQVGTQGPDFELSSALGKAENLSDLRGKRVVLTFYPNGWSPVCSDQMALCSQGLPLFAKHNTEALGLSVGSRFCHQAFADNRHLHFSLPDVPPHAQQAALAAEAAARQGKLWEMHDALYEHQNQLNNQHLEGFTQQLSLDVAKLKQARQSQAVANKVEADFESGIRSGVNGTPSFLVNGQKFDGDWQDQGLLYCLQGQAQ